MRDSICAPQVLVHLVHFSMSSCAYRITTSSDGLAVANGSALSARTHAQWLLGALAGNTPRRLWSTRNRTRGKIQRREARPLPAKPQNGSFSNPTGPAGPSRVHATPPHRQRQAARLQHEMGLHARMCAFVHLFMRSFFLVWFPPDWGLASWLRLRNELTRSARRH